MVEASNFFAENDVQAKQASIGNTIQVLTLLEDTITKGISIDQKKVEPEPQFIVPNRLANKTISFQVNSAINYLRFGHFKKNEAKKMFFQAWIKEKELARITNQTDSLRKVYASSSNDLKEEISVQIMKNEERTMTLISEVPVLNQNARNLEDQYWQSALPDEIARFQEKISLLTDSINQSKEKTINKTPAIPDTILLYKASPKAREIKPEPTSGIIYKIQIGAYKGKTPEMASKLIKKLSLIRKVENFKDEKGVIIYTTGNLKTWKDAVALQNQVKQEGVKNASITAYLKGKKITIDEAKKINYER